MRRSFPPPATTSLEIECQGLLEWIKDAVCLVMNIDDQDVQVIDSRLLAVQTQALMLPDNLKHQLSDANAAWQQYKLNKNHNQDHDLQGEDRYVVVEKESSSGCKKVIISAPAADAPIFFMGPTNEDTYEPYEQNLRSTSEMPGKAQPDLNPENTTQGELNRDPTDMTGELERGQGQVDDDETGSEDEEIICISSSSTSNDDIVKDPENSATPETFQRLQVPLEIKRASYDQASLIIMQSEDDARKYKWKVSIRKVSTPTGPVFYTPTQEYTGTFTTFNFPLSFEAGHQYQVTVSPVLEEGMHQGTDIFRTQVVEFKAECTLEDIRALHQMAILYVTGCGHDICKYFYRTKSPAYFLDIDQNHGGVMEVYIKDNSGDAGSPINLTIKGTFFMASVRPGSNGEPIKVSCFGSARICIPVEQLLELAPNLYFADFYCMKSTIHQVTLVLTKPGSDADNFCVQHLLPLNINNPTESPFIFFDAAGQLRVATRDHLVVEVLFTENVNISQYPVSTVPTAGKGSSTPGGIPKNSECTLCNLQPSSAFQKF